MRRTIALAFTAALSLASGGALAQGAPAPAEPAAEAPKPKPKPRGPRPAASIVLANASAATATEVVISAEDKTAKLTKPLAPKARTTLKMPKVKGCKVSVAATFEGEGQVDVGEFDICKEKTIRFTD